MDLVEIARARLAFRAAVAKAVRRQCGGGVEWSPQGYRALRRMRHVEQDLGKVPYGVTTIYLLRLDQRFGTALVEWEQGDRLVQTWLPQIAIIRFRRRYGNTVKGEFHG